MCVCDPQVTRHTNFISRGTLARWDVRNVVVQGQVLEEREERVCWRLREMAQERRVHAAVRARNLADEIRGQPGVVESEACLPEFREGNVGEAWCLLRRRHRGRLRGRRSRNQ